MAQGICDLEVPPVVLAAAEAAVQAGRNSYTPAAGIPELRRAVAEKMAAHYGLEVDPETEVMISAGATGAFHATARALLDPGDEVILPEPYYGYHAATLGALDCTIKTVPLAPPQWRLERTSLEEAVGTRTRAVVISNPSNPCGRVFDRTELEMLADFAAAHDLVIFSDEIYEHFVYDGRKQTPAASVAALRPRCVTISGLSKIFSITGWRLGYAVAPPEVVAAANRFNDLFYVCAPAPLQWAASEGLLRLGREYYREIVRSHQAKRDRFCDALEAAGLPPYRPEGAYYVLADISRLPGRDDQQRVMALLAQTGVAAVPGSAFWQGEGGGGLARFCFAKREAVLEEACTRLARHSG